MDLDDGNTDRHPVVTLTPRSTAFRPDYMHQPPDAVLVLIVFGANIEPYGLLKPRLISLGIGSSYTACILVASIIPRFIFTINSWKSWLGPVDDYHIRMCLPHINYLYQALAMTSTAILSLAGNATH